MGEAMTDAYQRSIYWLDGLLAADPDMTASDLSRACVSKSREPALPVPISEPFWSLYAYWSHGAYVLARLGEKLDRHAEIWTR